MGLSVDIFIGGDLLAGEFTPLDYRRLLDQRFESNYVNSQYDVMSKIMFIAWKP